MRGNFSKSSGCSEKGFLNAYPVLSTVSLPSPSCELPLSARGNSQGLIPGIGSGFGSPVTVAHTPDGSNVETISIDLPGTTGDIEFMDDGGVPPLLQLGGETGDQNVGEGFGGRSVESVDVDGPLDIGLNTLFGLQDSENTESSADVGGGLLTAMPSQGLAPSSLEGVGATGPLGIDLDVIMENTTGSALTSLVSVADGDAVSGQFLGGAGGRIDTLTLQGPLEAVIGTQDGGDAGFPLEVGDDSAGGRVAVRQSRQHRDRDLRCRAGVDWGPGCARHRRPRRPARRPFLLIA